MCVCVHVHTHTHIHITISGVWDGSVDKCLVTKQWSKKLKGSHLLSFTVPDHSEVQKFLYFEDLDCYDWVLLSLGVGPKEKSIGYAGAKALTRG